MPPCVRTVVMIEAWGRLGPFGCMGRPERAGRGGLGRPPPAVHDIRGCHFRLQATACGSLILNSDRAGRPADGIKG